MFSNMAIESKPEEKSAPQIRVKEETLGRGAHRINTTNAPIIVVTDAERDSASPDRAPGTPVIRIP